LAFNTAKKRKSRTKRELADEADRLSCSPATQRRQFTAAVVFPKFHSAFGLRDGKRAMPRDPEPIANNNAGSEP
jgi:hypothetical protein